MTTKNPAQATHQPRRNRRGRRPSPTQGWFSLEQRARFKGQEGQA